MNSATNQDIIDCIDILLSDLIVSIFPLFLKVLIYNPSSLALLNPVAGERILLKIEHIGYECLMKTEATKTEPARSVRERGAARLMKLFKLRKKSLSMMVSRSLHPQSGAELGIGIGNLHYYFSTKNDLLKVVIEDVIEVTTKNLRGRQNCFLTRQEKRIEAFVRYLIADAKKPEVRAFSINCGHVCAK